MAGNRAEKQRRSLATFAHTDLGNAERLVAVDGPDLRYCRGLGWFVWDGRRFVPDETDEVMRRMKATVRALYTEAGTIEEREDRTKVVLWARRSEAEARLRAAISLAESEAEVRVALECFDTDPFLLNVSNGTLDLRTFELRDHRRDDLLTKLAPTRFDPEAKLPLWDAFLQQTTGGNKELAEYLQRAIGYSLTGDTSTSKLFFAQGPGATGKTTFLEAVKTTLGDYAATADFETFLKRRGDPGIRNDIARLRGKRLVTSVEVDEGKTLAEGLVKAITGGDVVTARFLYREAFEFRPQFKLWMGANHRPRVNADDSAMWRRIDLIPFDHVVPEQDRDPKLGTELKTQEARAAILAWAVHGCVEWQRAGLNTPASVRAYTEAYRAENDPLRDWVADCCVIDEPAYTLTSELRESYERWAAASGERAIGTRAWAPRLEARGCRADKERGQRVWRGIALRRER